MPVITDIQVQKRNKQRVSLYLDGEFAYGLDRLTVLELGLKIGVEVADEQLREAAERSEKSVALQKAVDYVSRGMKTAFQVRAYLKRKEFSDAVCNYVLAKLAEYGYVNDELYAEMYVEQNAATKGSRRLKQELVNKGIDKERAEAHSEMDGDEARENASALAAKYMRGKTADPKTLQKLQRYLLGRGYDYDTVHFAVRNFRDD